MPLLILFVIICFQNPIYAQTGLLPAYMSKCQSNFKASQNMQKHPFLQNKRAQFLHSSKEWIEKNEHRLLQKNAKAIMNIPTVVHVVYANNTQNISDAQIQSQLQVLNDDFSRSNSDFSTVVPAVFQSAAADVEFNFCLAQVDPNGDATTGITRTMTTVANIGNSNNSNIFYSANGGKDSWDNSRYLNIYVCEIDGSGLLLGYATLPGTAPNGEDGVVIDYKYFGTTGTVSAPLDKGRTATHEVGHYFNLDHIWGNGCNTDDGVSDTPEQENNYGGCPIHPQTSCGSEDMFMNFMDYVNDNCMAFFTEGQKTRMHAALNTARSGLINNNPACGTSSFHQLDSQSDWSIYPNPTDRNTISIDIHAALFDQATLVIRNIQGLELSRRPIQSKTQIELSMLSSGVYLVELINNNKRYIKKLILK